MTSSVEYVSPLLWVNNQTGIFCEHDGSWLDQPKWPRSRRWKRCLAQLAVLKFDRQVSHNKVLREIRRRGFLLGDAWSLVSFMRYLRYFNTRDSHHPLLKNLSGLVAPARIHDTPYMARSEMVNGEIRMYLSHVPKDKNWEGEWLPRYRFLGVRFQSEVIDDFWHRTYKNESILMSENGPVVFDFHLQE